ncbi:MAG: OmpA family protein [Pseudomonadota bacterium]
MTIYTRLAGTGLILAVAGCSQPAGTLPGEETFGSATMQSMLAQTAYLNTDLLLNLAETFRSEVPDTVTFDFDSSALRPDARAALDQQVAFMQRHPNARFRVFGHTDLVGSNAYNQRLGLRRARAVVRYLVSNGIARNRLDAVTSLGETQPVVDTEAREERNRRTMTEVAGFDFGFVGDGMDGKRTVIVYNEYVNDAGSEIDAGDTTAGAGG